MMHVHTLILGAGLTGLSTAYHLQELGQTDYLLAECAGTPGGLCKSVYKDGFTFDYGGHLLHLHTPYGKKLVKKLLKTNLKRLPRRAWIYTQNTRVPFPFQANLFALSPAVRQACVDGLLTATQKKYTTAPKNFKDWCLRSFGTGVYEAFMRPYNTKLWGRPPEELTADWCGPFVPLPTPKEIIQSAQKTTGRKFGYNAYFYYPQTGGCQALIDALTKRVKNLRLNAPVSRVNLCKKTAVIGRKTISFDYIVNTLPLPEFLRLLEGEKLLSHAADKLAGQSVTVYNLAVRGPQQKPFSWIYCPDGDDPFFRVGLQSSFSPTNAPAGCRSYYIELPGKAPRTEAMQKRIWNALIQKGIINRHDEKLFSFWQFLPYAYAVYDKKRNDTVQKTLAHLEQQGCLCAGRYGKWEYSFMEKSLLEGLETAQKLV